MQRDPGMQRELVRTGGPNKNLQRELLGAYVRKKNLILHYNHSVPTGRMDFVGRGGGGSQRSRAPARSESIIR